MLIIPLSAPKTLTPRGGGVKARHITLQKV